MKLSELSDNLKEQFKKNAPLLSLEEFIKHVESNSKTLLRPTATYAADMMDHFGKKGNRFNIFDRPIPGIAAKTIGHEFVQNEIYRMFRSFSKIGMNNRLVLLHGPNGSAKSTLIQSVMQGLEEYSKTDPGAAYTFSWVFPIDKITRGSLGIRGELDRKSQTLTSYASLNETEIACVIPSEFKDHPALLIPKEHRKKWFKELNINPGSRLTDGGLSHRDQLIFDALLKNHRGDIDEVYRYIRVERFYYSKMYRSGLVTVEPQMHVDAQFQQLTLNKSLSQLPTSLQGINLFSVSGDLADANRGMIDFADLLKRPIDTYKYLLTACELGQVNVGHTIMHLDTILIGSSNDLQLDAFKEYPDFSSFKGRIELIRVPYLLRLTDEVEIYESMLKQFADNKQTDDKPITPHVAWALGFWAVLTRLKKPSKDRYPSDMTAIMDRLTPMDKLKIYDSNEVPDRYNTEERKLLKSHLHLIREEYLNVPFFEGRTGASARELKTLLIETSQNSNYKTLSPLAILQELQKFVKRTTEYEFLRQDSVDGFHNHEGFIETVKQEYLIRIDREVRECLGLYETKQWSEFMKKYILNLSAFLKSEKLKNQITGDYEAADQALINEFETIVEAPIEPSLKEQFRKSLITQIAAWSLDHPKEGMDYFKVFPELRQKIEKHYYESQKSLLQKMNTAIKLFGSNHEDPTSEGTQLAKQTIKNMQEKFNYPELGAVEVIGFLLSERY